MLSITLRVESILMWVGGQEDIIYQNADSINTVRSDLSKCVRTFQLHLPFQRHEDTKSLIRITPPL